MSTRAAVGRPKRSAERTPAPVAPEEATQARERILDAAEAEFARKGFEGARIDKIAEAAGVNKALIYYYFKGKKALLEELVQRLLVIVTTEKEDAYASFRPGDPDFTDAVVRRAVKTLQERMPIFTVLCMEALKCADQNPALFRVFDRLVKTSAAQAGRHGYSIVGLHERRVPALFFGVLPLVFFLLLKKSWVAHYKVDESRLEEEFFRHFASIFHNLGPAVLRKKK
jgi:AcrR family transcriptional regulator